MLVAAVGGVVFSGTPARAEIVAKDPALKAALKEYENFSANALVATAKTDSARPGKKPVKMPALLGSLFPGLDRQAAPGRTSP